MSSKEYWDKRYTDEGKVWGEVASKTAEHALDQFRLHRARTVLVPGSGYGRNTRLLSASGFEVTGVEISEAARRLAHKHDPATVSFGASALDLSFLVGQFDAVYCFNVLHLFRKADRVRLLDECAGKLTDRGLMFFTVFSEAEPTFGAGAEIEPNTFESRPGRPVHYFTDDDIRAHFRGFKVMATGLMEDMENHGEGPHTHILRYILARKA